MTKAVYSAQVVGAFTTNVDSLAVEITAAANTTIKIKKIRIMHGDGTDLTTADYHTRVKLVRESVAGTGGGVYTPVPLDGNATPAVATVKTGVFTPGTISSTVDIMSVHSNNDFYWMAADENDTIVVAPGGIFGVILRPSA